MPTKMRKTNKTLLLVGEGYDEKAFLTYLKRQLNNRSSGLTVTVKNAKGGGAESVINWTIRQISIANYDTAAVLFDTDTGWSQAIEKLAKSKKMVLLKCDPRFEAMMLRLKGVTPKGNSASEKSQFKEYVANTTDPNSYAQHYDIDFLIENRSCEMTVDTLLNLFGQITE